MRGGVEVNQFAAIMAEHDEAVEYSETDRVNGEEVDGCDVFHMVLQKRSPGLRRWLSRTKPVFPDRGFSDIDTEQSKLIADPWRAPGWVVARHLANEFSNIKRDLRSPDWLRSGLPSPVEAEALVVPSDYGFWFDDDKVGTPVDPEARQPDPDDPIGLPESRTLGGALEHGDLMTKGEVLNDQR